MYLNSKWVVVILFLNIFNSQLKAEGEKILIYRGITNELPSFNLKISSFSIAGTHPKLILSIDFQNKVTVYIPKYFHEKALYIKFEGIDSLSGKHKTIHKEFDISNLPQINAQLGTLKSPGYYVLPVVMLQSRLFAFFDSKQLNQRVKIQILGYDCEINNGLLLQSKMFSVIGPEIKELKEDLSGVGKYKYSIKINHLCVKVENDTYHLAPLNYTNVFNTNDFVLRLKDRSGNVSYSNDLDQLDKTSYQYIEYLSIQKTDTIFEHKRKFSNDGISTDYIRSICGRNVAIFKRITDSSYQFSLKRNEMLIYEGFVESEQISNECDLSLNQVYFETIGMSNEQRGRMNVLDSILLTIEQLGLHAFGNWTVYDQTGKKWLSGNIVSNKQLQYGQIKELGKSSAQDIRICPFPFYSDFHAPEPWSVFNLKGKIVRNIEAVLYKEPFKYWD